MCRMSSVVFASLADLRGRDTCCSLEHNGVVNDMQHGQWRFPAFNASHIINVITVGKYWCRQRDKKKNALTGFVVTALFLTSETKWRLRSRRGASFRVMQHRDAAPKPSLSAAHNGVAFTTVRHSHTQSNIQNKLIRKTSDEIYVWTLMASNELWKGPDVFYS